MPVMVMKQQTSERSGRRSVWALALAVLLTSAVLALPAPALAITRDAVLSRAQSWMDLQVPYSQSNYFHGYRTDCSGFTSMSWKTTTRTGHAYSWTTWTLPSVTTTVTTDTIQPGDAMVWPHHHSRVFYGWLDSTHTWYIAYEESGPKGSPAVMRLHSYATDIATGYVARSYKKIEPFNPRWNAVSNAGFGTWVSGLPPVWWTMIGSPSAASLQRRTVSGKGQTALRLVNPSSRSKDVVGVSQSASVTAGVPYRLSALATATVPGVLTITLTFVDDHGTTISTVTTTGPRSAATTSTAAAWISLTATAPALAERASYGVKLGGAVNASGSVGATAAIDQVRLYDASPTSMTFTVSKTTLKRGAKVTLQGQLTSPFAIGTVRVWVVRPGKTKAVLFFEKPLVMGAWSRTYLPALLGTYRYYATWAGYGAYGPLTSSVKRLKVTK